MNADNVVIMSGRLARDVETRSTTSGLTVSRFTLAINRSRAEADGTRKADFHNCIAFGKTADAIAKYFTKGSAIGIQGELQDDNYTGNDGMKHYNKQIVVDGFSFRESKNAQTAPDATNQPHTGPQRTGGNTYQPQPKPAQAVTQASNDPFASNGKQLDISDPDLPF